MARSGDIQPDAPPLPIIRVNLPGSTRQLVCAGFKSTIIIILEIVEEQRCPCLLNSHQKCQTLHSAKCPNSPRKIESTKMTHNLQRLLLKYGGINVDCGVMCRSCIRRLITIHEKVSSFQELCKQNYRSTVFQSKRLASIPISNNSKIQRQEPQTFWNNLNSPTKIPTPLRYSGSQINKRANVPLFYSILSHNLGRSSGHHR